MAMIAIAKRRKLLNDDVIFALTESSWEILDVAGSDVSDFGLSKISEMCTYLRAVDIRGCPRSDYTARRCLGILEPKLNHVEGESWEELDTTEIASGAESLRWLVWPKIDKDSSESLSAECPRIVVNPKPSPFGYRGIEIPKEALQNVALDAHVIKDIDPKTWAVSGFTPRATTSSVSNPTDLPMAEKFRLAYLERDTRLAPKRAKNARQRQRRAEREWVMSSTSAKAIALASQVTKSHHI